MCSRFHARVPTEVEEEEDEDENEKERESERASECVCVGEEGGGVSDKCSDFLVKIQRRSERPFFLFGILEFLVYPNQLREKKREFIGRRGVRF